MALVHRATLAPTKLELLQGWLPSRPWFPGGPGPEIVGSYRFDDPDGEVGLEGQLVRTAEGTVVHAPLTYRGAPLAGGEEFLVGTTEHSVLGTRWVYDACGDAVWAAALARAVLTGGRQADVFIEVDGRHERREPTTTVEGSGAPGTPVPAVGALHVRDEGSTTVTDLGGIRLVVARVLPADLEVDETLTARWPDGGPTVVAGVRLG